jgi:phosphatidate cytidylyltransferase
VSLAVTEILLFVGGLFLAGAAIIAALGRRAGGAAAQSELWAYFRSEFMIAAAVLVPAMLHPLAVVVCVLLAIARFAWEIHTAAALRPVPRTVLDLAFLLAVLVAAYSLLLLATRHQGLPLLVFMFVCTEMQDAMAFLVGRIFGRTRFMPRLSPKKTLEGTAGGIVGGMLAGSAFAHQYLHWGWAVAFGISAICTVGGIMGDLLVSAYKRSIGIKDFVAIHRLHGGLLDVYDSLVFCAPCLLAGLWLAGGGR